MDSSPCGIEDNGSIKEKSLSIHGPTILRDEVLPHRKADFVSVSSIGTVFTSSSFDDGFFDQGVVLMGRRPFQRGTLHHTLGETF